jgi:hypothetical protein
VLGGVAAPARHAARHEVLVRQLRDDHRDDAHPLEEAEGYRSLMIHAQYDVAKIAERLGRSVKYVYDGVNLLQITPRGSSFSRARSPPATPSSWLG